MPLNHDAVGTRSPPHRRAWTSTNAMLYAVGVGAGAVDPFDELAFTTENTKGVAQQVLPTFAVIVGGGGPGSWDAVGDINWTMLVHGEQSIECHGPIPPDGEVEAVSEVVGIWDKGSGALVQVRTECTDVATGNALFTSQMGAFIRGEGGWGGERGPAGATIAAIPDRPADHVVAYGTRPDQALLYRLSGDRNPLHSDPSFATAAGFDKPILHGLCTFGFTGRALLHSLCKGDPARLRTMDARFSKPVWPGDTLTVSIWETGAGEAVFQTRRHGDIVVVDGGVCRFEPA